MKRRQWFHGQLDGQYVGRPKGRRESVATRAGEVFEIEITRAAVTEIVLGPLEIELETVVETETEAGTEPTAAPPRQPTHHHQCSGAFHQPSIAQVFFLDAMGPGRTVRSGAHDVLVSRVELSDATRHDGRTYGRIQGTASGWFRPLPPAASPEEVRAPERPLEVWQSEVLVSTPAPVSNQARQAAQASNTRSERLKEPHLKDSSTQVPAGEVIKPEILTPSPETSDAYAGNDASGFLASSGTAYAESDLPFFTLGSVLAVGVFAVAGWFAALTWYASFLPALGLRRWLYGIIPEGWFTRGVAIAATAVQLLTATLLVASWQDAGCKTLHPLLLAFLLCGQYACCVLPRAPAFALAAGSFAAVIAHFYGPLGSICP